MSILNTKLNHSNLCTKQHTNLVGDYSFQHVVNKEQDASGADIRGRLILIEANKMKDILENMLNVITM